MKSDQLLSAGVGIVAAIIGVATLATVLSQHSNTSGVIAAAGKAFSSVLGAAVSPVTGGGNQYLSQVLNTLQVPSLTGGGVSTIFTN